MVTLAYEYGAFEKPQEDMDQGGQLAASSCSNCGYTNANPFGETRTCDQVNIYGNCLRWQVNRRYQCTGQPEAKAVVVVPK